MTDPARLDRPLDMPLCPECGDQTTRLWTPDPVAGTGWHLGPCGHKLTDAQGRGFYAELVGQVEQRAAEPGS